MLFIIDEEFITSDDPYFMACLEHLMTAYIEGSHCLYIQPKSMEFLKERYWDQFSKGLQHKILHFEAYTMLEMKAIYKAVNTAIRILPSMCLNKIVQNGDQIIREITSNEFLYSFNLQKTTLLGENLLDADIYQLMGEHFVNTKLKGQNIEIKCNISNGGGNTTADVFERKIQVNEELCFCILDSDKKDPMSTLGDTAKKVIKVSKNKILYKYDFYVEERTLELENMLPFQFYSDIYSHDVNKAGSIKTLGDFLKYDELISQYLDMKNGIKHHLLLSNYFWKDKLKHLVNPNFMFCYYQMCSNKDDCRYLLVKGFGSKILKDFIAYYKLHKNDFEAILNKGTKEIIIIWEHIGRIIFSWCCGSSYKIAIS